jgi:hypothetical protein
VIDHYDWAGGREAMVRLGPDNGPVVIVALPLFEEANRTRTFAMGLMRRLAVCGVASALPDLPGQGESLVATEHAMLAGWRAAFAAAAAHIGDRQIFSLAMRGGALIDTDTSLAGRWHLAPAVGSALIRELLRAQAVSGVQINIDLSDAGDLAAPILISGNRIARQLLRELNAASPVREGNVRVVRLATDPAVADLKVDGVPLWRQAEPGDDPALADLLSADIADWIAQCGA